MPASGHLIRRKPPVEQLSVQFHLLRADRNDRRIQRDRRDPDPVWREDHRGSVLGCLYLRIRQRLIQR